MAKAIYFYGIHAIQALLSQRPTDALELFVQHGRDDEQVFKLIDLAKTSGVSVQSASKDKLAKLCGSLQHQGVVLNARPLNPAPDDLLENLIRKEDSFFLVLDQVTDSHNFGACLRTAFAMGVDAIICPKHHSASLTPTVAKVSVGAMEILPVIAVTNLANTLKMLKQAGVFVFGAALDVNAKPLNQVEFTSKVAIVMGSEGEGMRRLTSELCDVQVYIPMHRHPTYANVDFDSLNVSVATGMMLYEVNRQRWRFNQ